jgi:hypothetical protein
METNYCKLKISEFEFELEEELRSNGELYKDKIAYLKIKVQVAKMLAESAESESKTKEELDKEISKLLKQKKAELKKEREQLKQKEEDKKEAALSAEQLEEREKSKSVAREAAEAYALKQEQEKQAKLKKAAQDEIAASFAKAQKQMEEADKLLQHLNENEIPDSDPLWKKWIDLSEKASIDLITYAPAEPTKVLDMGTARKNHAILRMEVKIMRYEELIALYRKNFPMLKYSPHQELPDDDDPSYYQELEKSYNIKKKNLESLKVELIKMVEDDELFSYDIDFEFDDQPTIQIIFNKILQEYKLVAKIHELDLKLVEAGLEECSKYTDEEYTKKMVELQNHLDKDS